MYMSCIELPVLRNAKKEVIKFDGTNYSVACWQGNICEKCPRSAIHGTF